MQKKNNYSNEFKAKIVMEILKEEKTFSQISSEHKIHNSVIRRWYSEFVENLPNIFSDKNKEIKKVKEEYEKQVQDLYVEVGRLSTENTWLKKKSGITF